MFEANPSPFLVPFDGRFRISEIATGPGEDGPSRKRCEKGLAHEIQHLRPLQRLLYAGDHHSVLCVFQAMDAAGKDGTIRAVLSGLDPSGCQVHSFKQPSSEEIDHDFLWRTAKALPERGRIGIFNRSYYEEVLVVRVHPGILDGQRLPDRPSNEELFAGRYQSIRDHEAHLARNGVVVLKFWLNVSKDEQAHRFLARLEDPTKQWKFSSGDVRERGHWDEYMAAYEAALRETSRPWAPWYAIPADDKRYMRWQVARILRKTLQGLGLANPEVDPEARAMFDQYRKQLEGELS